MVFTGHDGLGYNKGRKNYMQSGQSQAGILEPYRISEKEAHHGKKDLCGG